MDDLVTLYRAAFAGRKHVVKLEAVLFGQESPGESLVSSDVRKVICRGKRFQVQGVSFDKKFSLKLTDIREIVMEKSRLKRLESFKDLVLDELPPLKDDAPARRVDSAGYFEVGHQFKGKKAQGRQPRGSRRYERAEQSRDPTIHDIMWMDVKLMDKVESSSSKTSRRSHSTSSKSAAVNAALLENKHSTLHELREAHGGKGYSDEQLQVWAFMVTQGTADVEEPPKKRFSGHRPNHASKTSKPAVETPE